MFASTKHETGPGRIAPRVFAAQLSGLMLVWGLPMGCGVGDAVPSAPGVGIPVAEQAGEMLVALNRDPSTPFYADVKAGDSARHSVFVEKDSAGNPLCPRQVVTRLGSGGEVIAVMSEAGLPEMLQVSDGGFVSMRYAPDGVHLVGTTSAGARWSRRIQPDVGDTTQCGGTKEGRNRQAPILTLTDILRRYIEISDATVLDCVEGPAGLDCDDELFQAMREILRLDELAEMIVSDDGLTLDGEAPPAEPVLPLVVSVDSEVAELEDGTARISLFSMISGGLRPYRTEWRLVSGPQSVGSIPADGDGNAVEIVDSIGPYTFELTVTDAEGAQKIASTTAVVEGIQESEVILTLTQVGEGRVSPPPGKYVLTPGSRIEIVASDTAGWRFTGFSGDAVSSSTSLTMVIEEDMLITANFEAVPTFALTVDVVPSDAGRVRLRPSEGPYSEGRVVQVTAVPYSGFAFVEFEGDVSATSQPETVNVVMDQDKLVIAHFEEVIEPEPPDDPGDDDDGSDDDPPDDGGGPFPFEDLDCDETWVNTSDTEDDHPVEGVVVYVDAAATGNNDGTSWTDAFEDLPDALDATFGRSEIWVAAGTYTPAGPGGDRAATFALRDGMALYGGFAGGELLRSQRDIEANVTILSGDLDVNDDQGIFNDNSFHVVTAVGVDETTILNGFTISGGNGDVGGGMMIDGGGPRIVQCTFFNNSASRGAGLYAEAAGPTIKGCTFRENVSGGDGGAIYVVEDVGTITECLFEFNSGTLGGALAIENSSITTISDSLFRYNIGSNGGAMQNIDTLGVTVEGCRFVGNTALGSGAVWNNHGTRIRFVDTGFCRNFGDVLGAGVTDSDCEAEYVRCLFRENSGGGDGGAITAFVSNSKFGNSVFVGNSTSFSGGGIFAEDSNVTLANCVLFGNSSRREGGALRILTSRIEISNCTLVENEGDKFGAGLSAWNTVASIANSIFWANAGTDEDPTRNQIGFVGNTPDVYFSCVQDGWDGGAGNIADDPLFVEGELRLSPGSPCVDAGDAGYLPPDALDVDGDGDVTEPLPLDLDGNPRVSGAGVDMGAYELP